jgi:ABC-type uncharacterized transport system ATPase subunit
MSAALETLELTMRFGGVLAVDRVSLSLGERELRCLIGPNGAGKSTFFKCIIGQYRLGHDSGRVLIRGSDVTGAPTLDIVRLGIGVKTQVPSVMNGMTVYENLWLAARRVHGWAASGAGRRQTSLSPNCTPARSCGARSASWRTASARWWRSEWCWCRSRGWCCSTSPPPV